MLVSPGGMTEFVRWTDPEQICKQILNFIKLKNWYQYLKVDSNWLPGEPRKISLYGGGAIT